MKGLFVTFEGVEGCGKSTQIELLAKHLRKQGREVVSTREPGGTPLAEAVRALLLDPANGDMHPVAELLLYEAARAQHVAGLIRPALDRGAVVLSDRFYDSTTAYQGAGRKLPMDTVEQLHVLATGGLRPDRTFLLDLPAETGLKRARSRGRSDRIESESLRFHRSVREAFLALARREPGRITIVDAAEPIERVALEIQTHIDAALLR